jgi:hypothetical protein
VAISFLVNVSDDLCMNRIRDTGIFVESVAMYVQAGLEPRDKQSSQSFRTHVDEVEE